MYDAGKLVDRTLDVGVGDTLLVSYYRLNTYGSQVLNLRDQIPNDRFLIFGRAAPRKFEFESLFRLAGSIGHNDELQDYNDTRI
jgi:hypothetical protein